MVLTCFHCSSADFKEAGGFSNSIPEHRCQTEFGCIEVSVNDKGTIAGFRSGEKDRGHQLLKQTTTTTKNRSVVVSSVNKTVNFLSLS